MTSMLWGMFLWLCRPVWQGVVAATHSARAPAPPAPSPIALSIDHAASATAATMRLASRGVALATRHGGRHHGKLHLAWKARHSHVNAAELAVSASSSAPRAPVALAAHVPHHAVSGPTVVVALALILAAVTLFYWAMGRRPKAAPDARSVDWTKVAALGADAIDAARGSQICIVHHADDGRIVQLAPPSGAGPESAVALLSKAA